MLLRIFSYLFFSLLCTNAYAAERYQFDNRHTNIMWFASHFGFSKSMGQFMQYEGFFDIDEQKPENSSVEITIDTASVMTGLEGFDRHLKGTDFFDTENFPKALFKSTKVTRTGKNTAKIAGNLTLRGVTQPITLSATLNKIGVNPYNKKQTAGFTVTGSFKRSDFGIKYALPGVSDKVDILIEAEGVKEENESEE
jgi:polyisoprenoid-binding protein YceI